MNSNDCILTITTNYNKSFDIKSKNMISIKDIKEQSIKEFNLSNIDKNLLELYLPDGNGKKIYILDEDDIIRNADDTDEDNPTLELNLFIKEESDSQNKNNSKESNNINNINNKNNKNNYKIIIIEKNDKKYSQMEEENKELKKEIEENKKEIKQLKESIEEIKNLLIEKKVIKEKVINNIYESVVINNKNNENKNINDKIQTDDNQNINKKQEKSSQEQTSINLDNSTSENNNNNNNEIKKDAPLDDENNKKGEKDNNKEKIHISQSCAEMINSDSPNDTNNEKKNEENNPTPQGPDSKTGETEQQENKQNLNMDLINKIRNEYGKDLDEFSDEKIQKKLEENDNDFQRTVMELMLGTTKYELQKK